MSPALVLTKDRAELHIPWKLPVSDWRSDIERITAEENICSVVFTGQDTCAVCCILNADGGRENSFFIKGAADMPVPADRSQRSWINPERSRAAVRIPERMLTTGRDSVTSTTIMPTSSADRNSPIRLIPSIREKLKYKAYVICVLMRSCQFYLRCLWNNPGIRRV